MAKKCSACGRYANTAEGVKCNRCQLFYHKICVKMPSDAQVPSSWQCPECKAQTPRKDNSEVPVREERADYTMSHADQNNPAEASYSLELLKEIKLMREDMQAFRNEFQVLRGDFSAVRSAVEVFGGRMDSLESRLDELEGKCAEIQARPDVGVLLSTIDELKSQLNERDQEALSNDLEITGIPEEPGENVLHLVSLIASKLSVSCEERDLVSVQRVGLRRPYTPTSSCEGAAPARPRPIVVRLARHQLREEFLQGARVRRGATTDGIGLKAAPTRFFVNERLSKFNRSLFFLSRKEAHTHAWKYVWTKGGRIFVRRETNTEALRVRTEADLKKYYGSKQQR